MTAPPYFKMNGKRYYVIEIVGGTINPDSGSYGAPPGVTCAVLDRDNMHREIAVFGERSASQFDTTRRRAEEFAERLNAEDVK